MQQVATGDEGIYECGGGINGNIERVADETLELQVARLSRTQADTLSRKIYIHNGQTARDETTIVCVHGSLPTASVTVWLMNKERVNASFSITSGIYTVSFLTTHESHGDHNVYECALQIRDNYLIFHRFERPVIKFISVTEENLAIEENDSLLDINVAIWVISRTNLLSPLTCSTSVARVRYYGTRAANFNPVRAGSQDELREFSLRCEASNEFGQTINSYRFSLILQQEIPPDSNISLTTYPSTIVYPSTEPTTAVSQSGPPLNHNLTTESKRKLSFLLPEFLRTTDGLILFSILICLTFILVITLIFCLCKLYSSYQTRETQMSRNIDGYWSQVTPNKRGSLTKIAKRALPRRPDSVYNTCDTFENPVHLLAVTHERSSPISSRDAQMSIPNGTKKGKRRTGHANCHSCACKKRKHARSNIKENGKIEQTYFMETNCKEVRNEVYFEPIANDDIDMQSFHLYSSSIDQPMFNKELNRLNSLPNLQSIQISRIRKSSV